MEIKTKNKQMRPLQTCTAKETINKMKRQPTDWEKIFTNDMTDKRSVSKFTTSPGVLPHPGIEPGSPALQADPLPSELPEKPTSQDGYHQKIHR